MDKIFFRHFELAAQIGVLPHEKLAPQIIYIDVEFNIDVQKAAATDTLENTTNYVLVKEAIAQVATSKHHNLLETLAEKIAQHLMQQFHFSYLKLSIAKPQVFSDMEAVGITVERARTA